jgi:hypothetical protein
MNLFEISVLYHPHCLDGAEKYDEDV